MMSRQILRCSEFREVDAKFLFLLFRALVPQTPGDSCHLHL